MCIQDTTHNSRPDPVRSDLSGPISSRELKLIFLSDSCSVDVSREVLMCFHFASLGELGRPPQFIITVVLQLSSEGRSVAALISPTQLMIILSHQQSRPYLLLFFQAPARMSAFQPPPHSLESARCVIIIWLLL